jgi:hypothetical protein
VVRRKWNVFQVLKEKKASTVSNKNTLQEWRESQNILRIRSVMVTVINRHT